MRLFNIDFSNMHEVNLVQFNFLDLAPMKGASVSVTPWLYVVLLMTIHKQVSS